MQGVRWSLPWVPCWVVRQSAATTFHPPPGSSPRLHPPPGYSPRQFHQQQCQKIMVAHTTRVPGIQDLSRGVWSPRQCVLCATCVTPTSWTTQRKHYAVDSNSDLEDEGFICDSEFYTEGFDKSRMLDRVQFDQLRVSLYPCSCDPVIRAMNEANSVQEVFDQVERCGDKLTGEQASQAVVTLWDLQKVFGQFGIYRESITGSQLNQFLEKIMLHPVFEKLITCLESVHKDLSNTAVSCMLLYLNKMGVRKELPLMWKLEAVCLERLRSFNLGSLSRFCVYLRDLGLKSYYLQSKVLPFVAVRIRSCSTCDELHLLTICLSSSRSLITEVVMDKYIALIEQKLNENIFETCDPKIILKIIKLLTVPEWSSKRKFFSRRLMLCLVDRIPSLSVSQLLDLSSYYRSYLEPRQVLQNIQRYSMNMFEESSTLDDKQQLLYIAPYTSPKLKNYYEELVAEYLDRKDLYEYIVLLFKILRYVKTFNFKLCNAFWTKSMNAVEKEIQKKPIHFLGLKDMMRRNVYHRYMYFNNNLGGTYRNYPVEKKMSVLLLEDINSVTGMVPSKLAYMTSFLLSYSSKEGLPENVVERVLLCGPQFSIFDSMILSRGIQVTLAINTNIKRTLMQQITALCRMLDSRAEEHLKTVNSLMELTSIGRSYVSRGGSPRAFLFEKILAAHLPVLSQLNSRHVRDICLSLNNARYLDVEILNAIIQYISEHGEYIHVETVELVLSCLYRLGHHPPEDHRFFHTCTAAISEDGAQLSSLYILQMCLALNMFGHLPPTIIHDIFNLSFIDHLDEELSKCSPRMTYPMQVRHMLMELNRAVCLDHPEENIPWFHEKYCQELLESVAVPSSVFHTEVHQALVQLVGGPEVLRANAHTPYYYLLDFEFLLDAESRPVPVKEYTSGSHLPETQPGFRRVAVLVRREEDYCINTRQLLGRHQVERRHLEVLGYEVVEVPHFRWYSMSLSTFRDRMHYLRGLVYPPQA